MKNKRNLASAIVVFGAVLALSGCGGGGGRGDSSASNGSGDGSNSTSSIPGSAMASVDAFVSYMKLHIAGSSDMSSPVSLGNAVAPMSDTATPVGL